MDLGNSEPFRVSSLLEIEVVLDTDTMGGIVFDLNSRRYKFAAIVPDADQVVIGHVTKSGAPVFDAVANFTIESGVDHQFWVSLKGTSVTVYLDGQALLGYFFNSATADGEFGLYTMNGATSFDSIEVRTNDPSVSPSGGQPLAATPSAGGAAAPSEGLEVNDLEPVVDRALQLWSEARPAGFGLAALETTTFEIVDLPGRLLGLTVGHTVKLDPTAAGHGWFAGRFTEEDDGAGRIDLLTAVLHELGHVLGLAHDAEGGGLMAARLETGQRWLPIAVDRDAVVSGSLAVGVRETDGGLNSTDPSPPVMSETTDRAITDPPVLDGRSLDRGREPSRETFGDLTSDPPPPLPSLDGYATGLDFDRSWSVSARQTYILPGLPDRDPDDDLPFDSGSGVKRILLPPRRPNR